jgi:hypothetical protein
MSSSEEEFNGNLKELEDNDEDDDIVATKEKDRSNNGTRTKGDVDDAGSEEGEIVEEDITSARKRPAAQMNKSYAESDDDDDDDVPLASLLPGNKKKNANSDVKKKKNGVKETTPLSKKKKPSNDISSKNGSSTKKMKKPNEVTPSSSGRSSSKSYDWASAALYGTECEKGLLIQRILCRWWYAYKWPDPVKIPKKPPANYDALDGFPGVYVCTNITSSKIGKIKDIRNHEDCPSFENFSKKSASDLKDLLIKALTEQKRQLIELEGPGTVTEKDLTRLLSWTNRLNCDKADREALKVLKAQKLLPK